MSELLEHVTVDTSDNPEVSVIWLHGLGADGNDFVPIVRELDLAGLPGIRFIFPHAREAFIAREKARGIPASRIVLAGFSQGCAMTIQAGLRHPEALAGMICLSGYVPLSAKLALERSQESLATPIFMAHGRHDNVVPFNRAEMSRDLLVSLGYQVEWHEYAMQHSVCLEEVQHLSAFFKKVLG
jgi:phospholipase/carboxylesterase